MSVNITVPTFPESVEEGTLSAWHKKAGETVQKNEKIADIETDKIVLEVSAPEAGSLASIKIEEGSSVKPGDVLGVIDPSAKAESSGDKKGRQEPGESDEPEPEPEPETGEAEEAPAKTPEPAAAPARSAKPSRKKTVELDPRIGPAARKLILENDLNPEEIDGTGRGGRITKSDVLRFMEHSPHLSTQFGASGRSDDDHGDDAPPTPAKPEVDPKALTRRVPMSRIRARIAERLVEAQQNAALLTTFNEVNMKAIMGLRKRYQEPFQKQHNVKLGFMSFFVKAVVEALERFPIVNASVEGDDILYHGYYNIGVAVKNALEDPARMLLQV
jgi:2-oxoglutarate dehydrogenase E2 component (dihydrolipoamide succinyltransferase)